jgi:tRNA-2-methylthio-N6-dimethylallyladenosine synthase
MMNSESEMSDILSRTDAAKPAASAEDIIASIDPAAPVPEDGDLRQFAYIAKMRRFVAEKAEMMRRPLTACVVTFGCQMNARDSEKIAGVLRACGFVMQEEENADFVLYNTCTVRDNADQHVYGRLGRLGGLCRENDFMKVAICGCMMQEQSCIDKIHKSYPFVRLIFGTYNIYCFPEYLWEVYHSKKRVTEVWDHADRTPDDLPVERKYFYKSGVNIMYGCNNFCSYCIVPYVRGRERSRKPEDILCEIRALAASGVKEVMLLGQNVNSYGKTLEHPMTFAALLEEVCRIDGIERVRFMSSHPKDLSDELIDVIARNPKVARHVHLALQSGSDRILAAMNRHYTKAQFLALAAKIRERIPDVAISTDIIVGFPGETAADVDETIDVIRQVKFENAFTFIYSMRTGTPAAKMEQVPEEEKKANFSRLLTVVQDTAKEQAAKLQGRTFTALIEEENAQLPGYVTGRLSDNMIVHVKGDPSLIGTFADVRLDECRGFYYIGTIEQRRCEALNS